MNDFFPERKVISLILPPSYVRGNGINFLVILINGFDVCFIGIDVSIDGVTFKSVVFLMCGNVPFNAISGIQTNLYVCTDVFSPHAQADIVIELLSTTERKFSPVILFVFTGWNITSFTRSTGATKPCMPK